MSLSASRPAHSGQWDGGGSNQYRSTVQCKKRSRLSHGPSAHTQPIENPSSEQLHICLRNSQRPGTPQMITYVLRKTEARIRSCFRPRTISDPWASTPTQPIENPSSEQLHICLRNSQRPAMPQMITYVLGKTEACICCSFVALRGVKS